MGIIREVSSPIFNIQIALIDQACGTPPAPNTTRKKLINDTFNASLKRYNDTSLKCHGLDYHCISLHTMTLISSVIFVNQNYDIHLKRHSLLIIFQSNNLTMTLI